MAKTITLPLDLALKVHEYILLLRQAHYASGDVKRAAIEKLDGYPTPLIGKSYED